MTTEQALDTPEDQEPDGSGVVAGAGGAAGQPTVMTQDNTA